MDAVGGEPAAALHAYWGDFPRDVEVRDYAETLVHGVAVKKRELDAVIEQRSTNWRVAAWRWSTATSPARGVRDALPDRRAGEGGDRRGGGAREAVRERGLARVRERRPRRRHDRHERGIRAPPAAARAAPDRLPRRRAVNRRRASAPPKETGGGKTRARRGAEGAQAMIALTPVAADLPALDSVRDDAMVRSSTPTRSRRGGSRGSSTGGPTDDLADDRGGADHGRVRRVRAVLDEQPHRVRVHPFLRAGRRRDLTIERLRGAGRSSAASSPRRTRSGSPSASRCPRRIASRGRGARGLSGRHRRGRQVGWVTIIDDPEKVKKFTWTMPEGLKKKFSLARTDG